MNAGTNRVDDGLELRAYRSVDRQAVIALLAASLGREDDPRFEALYAWKHEENSFGVSPAWVAVDGEKIVGIRVLMRWQFSDGVRDFSAVRAVDTATHPEYQGRGIFTRLTKLGLSELGGESETFGAAVDFVFNTPNDQSRPGYLKMDWQVVGRLPVSVRPSSPFAIRRMLRARVPAERWSEVSTGGASASDVLSDAAAVTALLASTRKQDQRLQTKKSAEFLAWRYATPLLGYRAVVGSGGIEGGLAIFRVRRRGEAREAALVELIIPSGKPNAARALARQVRKAADCDFAIALGDRVPGFLPFPRQGPVLTWRHLTLERSQVPKSADLALTLGDIELF